jgi:hypothetical protein
VCVCVRACARRAAVPADAVLDGGEDGPTSGQEYLHQLLVETKRQDTLPVW